MKRYGGLWDSVVAWPNLVRAAAKAQRGKRDRPAVQHFNFTQEYQLYRLAEELDRGTYRPGAFRSHWIARPKPRLISAAPYRDRVVHHALMNVLEPILDRHFHPGSYACRKGKGTHAAADRLQELMRGNRWFVQCDVRKFFPSIDHEVLKGKYRRLVKDRRVLSLMDLILDCSNEQEPVTEWFAGDDLFAPVGRRRGLPIGNLTSQWFANWMLNDLDHFVTSGLGVGAFVRYCDDFILLHNDPDLLRDSLGKVVELLERDRLRLHEQRLSIRESRGGARFVGFRIWPTHRLLTKDNVRAFRRRVRWMKRAYAEGKIDPAEVRPRLVSWMGHARQADSKKLIRQLGREWKFVRGGAERLACPARGLVEQQTEELSFRAPQQERARQSEQQHRVPCRAALSTD
jgi:RNA-directed DNA polymerase